MSPLLVDSAVDPILKLVVMKTKYTRTHVSRFIYRSFLVDRDDVPLWTEAARSLGVSHSQFLREALKEKIRRTRKQNAPLNANRPEVMATL
jgi:hypothetical protein